MDTYKKKLLIITDMFPDEQNPVAGVFVRYQVDELSQMYQVRVLATYFPGRPGVRKSMHYHYPVSYVHYRLSRLLYPFTALGYWRWVVPELKRLIRDWQPSIIHVHDCRHVPELVCLSHVLKHCIAAKYLTVHNIKTLPERAEHRYLKYVYWLTLKHAYRNWEHVFFVNEGLRKRMGGIIPYSKSSYLGNAITPFEPVSDQLIDKLTGELGKAAFKLLSIGNLVYTKGFDYLVRAIAELVREGRRVTLQIIGSGGERQKLQSLVNSLDMETHIHLHPAIPNNIVRSLMSHYSAFVLPSFSETFGIVYIEALYAGLPVIGVRGQGIDGVIEDGISGLLCKPKDVTDLKDKIIMLMDNPEKAVAMGRTGQHLVKANYMMDSLIKRIMDVYEHR